MPRPSRASRPATSGRGRARGRVKRGADTASAGQVAGIGDEAVKKATGKTWAEWRRLIDRAGGASMSHRDIARALHEEHGVSGWWSQMVTVGYEQLTGRRQPHQTAQGWEANVSRTYAVPLDRLFSAWSDERLRGKWLAERGISVRAAVPKRSFRMTWKDGATQVDAWFVEKGPARSSVAVQHRKLGRQREVARMRSYWSDRLDALGRLLDR